MFYKNWFRSFLRYKPKDSQFSIVEILIISLGIGVISLLLYIANTTTSDIDPVVLIPFIVSAIMTFTMPSKTMTSEFVIIRSYILCSLIGFVFVNIFSYSQWGIIGAFALSFSLMVILNCLHLPAIMMTILIVILQLNDYQLILNPIGLDIAILLCATLIINKALAKAKRYSD